MANVLRTLVSKKKRRYKDEHFDLDLTYVTKNIIAMGFPSSNYERLYRNPMDEVKKFLEQRHRHCYKLWNLCIERRYDAHHFHGRVVEDFQFYDHNAPEWKMVVSFCVTVDEWLNHSDEHVAVIHCKAGKGRTGAMICCYLIWSGICKSADEALDFYGRQRTKNSKGVTIPSQKRYVYYLERVLAEYRKRNSSDCKRKNGTDSNGTLVRPSTSALVSASETASSFLSLSSSTINGSSNTGNIADGCEPNGNGSGTLARVMDAKVEQTNGNLSHKRKELSYHRDVKEESFESSCKSETTKSMRNSSDSYTVTTDESIDVQADERWALKRKSDCAILNAIQDGVDMNTIFRSPYPGQELTVKRIIMSPVPKKGIYGPTFTIRDSGFNVIYDYKKHNLLGEYDPRSPRIEFKCGVPLKGDVLFTFYKHKRSKEKRILSFWLNTEFIDDNRLFLRKKELDKVVRDTKKHKKYPENFCIEVLFSGGAGLPAPEFTQRQEEEEEEEETA